MAKVACILPKGEGFSPAHAGAIALCVRDNILCSRYKNDTYVIGSAKTEGFEGIQYYATDAARWYENRSRSYARQCIRTLKENRPDVVEVHNRPNLALTIAGCLPGSAVALHLHNDPQTMRGLRTPKERLHSLLKLKAVYCVSNYVRGQFLEGLPPEAATKVHIVYNGFAMPASLPPKEKTIIFVGRMTEEKGALPLAQALAQVLPQFPDWRVIFIGNKRHMAEDTLSPYAQSIATALQSVSGQTEFTGFIPHHKTMDYIARSEIAVVPSMWNEPFGRTALEALACKCALISSDRGGLKEVIGSAALVPTDITAEHLATALQSLLSNAEKRATLQQAAQAQAAHFAIADTTRTLDDIRADVMSQLFSPQHQR